MSAGAIRQPFGRLPDGREVELVTLRSASGFEARVMTYGAVLQALLVGDRDGGLADVVLGHDDLTGYVASRDFFGATIGRYANRIAGGRFSLGGETFEIAANDGPNALHGGAEGFDRQLWTIAGSDDASVRLHYQSADGEGGFPGALDVALTYRLVGEAALEIAFEARTTKPTVVNLTNHSFFNLGGAASVTDVLGHRIAIHAETYLPIDAVSFPEGGPAPVAGTPFDLRTPQPIGARIREGHEQIRRGRGYDHNYCIDGASGGEPRLAARVEDPSSGRVLELLTDQPGVQFYSGNFLDGTRSGKNGQSYRMGDAFCLEPQLYPDTPNRPDFPSARLDPGGVYRHRSIVRFSAI